MIAEEYLGRSRLFRRLKSGSHGQFIERYAARLVEVGLTRHGTWRSLNLVGDLLSWIARSGFTLTDLDEGMAGRYLRHRARKQAIQRGDRAALKRWLSVVLRDAGTIAPPAKPPITPQDKRSAEFGDYLQSQHWLAPRTIVRRLQMIRRFLCELSPTGRDDLTSARSASPTSSATPGTGAHSPGG
jgi:hypothetical protein